LSKVNLKTAWLYYRNKKPSVLVAHAKGMKATYKTMSHMLDISKKRYVIKMWFEDCSSADWIYQVLLFPLLMG
jgi:hypothetical protein